MTMSATFLYKSPVGCPAIRKFGDGPSAGDVAVGAERSHPSSALPSAMEQSSLAHMDVVLT
jgi:hypothetical protein